MSEPEIAITVKADPGKMTLDDMVLLETLAAAADESSKVAPPAQAWARLKDMLDRVCRFEGIENAGQLPFKMLPDVANSLMEQLRVEADVKN